MNDQILYSEFISTYLYAYPEKENLTIINIKFNFFKEFCELLYLNNEAKNTLTKSNYIENIIYFYKLIPERILLEFNKILKYNLNNDIYFIKDDLLYNNLLSSNILEFITLYLNNNHTELGINNYNLNGVLNIIENKKLIEAYFLKINKVLMKLPLNFYYPIEWCWNENVQTLIIIGAQHNNKFIKFLNSLKFDMELDNIIL